MSTEKKPNPPVDVIQEDSGPPLTGEKEPQGSKSVDVDDSQIEEPKDDAFRSLLRARYKQNGGAKKHKRAQAVFLAGHVSVGHVLLV
jgi:hypothetical protein